MVMYYVASPDGGKKHERLSKFCISKPTQRPLNERSCYPIDGKDLIGQAHELSGGEEEGVKCVWEKETDLEFVANEMCAHWLNIKFDFTFMRCLGPLMSLQKSQNPRNKNLIDGKDLIEQAHELSGGEEEGVKCVWEKETDLEFVANSNQKEPCL